MNDKYLTFSKMHRNFYGIIRVRTTAFFNNFEIKTLISNNYLDKIYLDVIMEAICGLWDYCSVFVELNSS